MKRLIFGVVLLLLLQTTVYANVLTNGSFENGLTGWSWSGYEPYVVGHPSHFCSANDQYSVLRQDVQLAPGTYQLDFSSYYTWSELPQPDSVYEAWPHRMRLAVLADGVEIAQTELSGWYETQWTQVALPTQQVSVNQMVSVVMTLDTGGGLEKAWAFDDQEGHWEFIPIRGYMYVDDVVLTATPVPEPAGFVLLISGTTGVLAGIRRKLRA